MPQFIGDGATFNFNANVSDWPTLSCSQANLLALLNSDLQLDAARSVRLQGGGQLSFQGEGQLSAQGALSFSTGGPTPSEKMRVLADGKVGIGTSTPSQLLEVNGAVKATDFIKGATPLVSSQWTDVTGGINYAGGRVGIGTTTPSGSLQIAGPQPDLFLVGNTTVNQDGLRLHYNETAGTRAGIIDVKGASLRLRGESGAAGAGATERLFIDLNTGNVGIGTTTPGFKVDVSDRMRVRQGSAPSAGLWFFQNTPNADRAFVGMASDSEVGFWGNTGAGWGLKMDTSNGNTEISGGLTIRGAFVFPKTSGGSAVLTNATYSNESNFQPNNVKLSMAATGLLFPIPPTLAYEFAIGHTSTLFDIGGGIRTSFIKKFSINQKGDAYFAGSKGGYVVDHFVNAVGDTLEQGDVIVLRTEQQPRYSGTNNNIPIPEVDLTTTPYDTRVCGIVAQVVTEQELPYVESAAVAVAEPAQEAIAQATEAPPYVHPLHQFAALPSTDLDQQKVGDQQMGKMVTLGAYAHCKVDADIAPIQAGDLLTTSPTAGHAQKVLDRSQATGAIIGKAMAALNKGKGKIAVLVMLQ